MSLVRPAARPTAASAQDRCAAVRSVRPRLAVAWLCALLASTLVLEHPAALLGLLLAVVLIARDLGALGPVWRLLRIGIVFAVLLVLVQLLINRNGLTVIFRLGDAGPLGQVDVTLEALAGAVAQSMRVLCGLAISGLSIALVDTDRVLASVRRRAPRAGVAATLTLRLAPALADDGRRYADGLRARADGAGLTARDRGLVVNALLGRTLDRASDAAGVLELRGLSSPVRAREPSHAGVPWSWAEQGAAVAALLTVVATVLTRLSGADHFDAFPLLDAAPVTIALAAGLLTGAATAIPLGIASRKRGRSAR
ncbi:MAG: hypothetical protein JHD16_03965 [Solirubrobacteraceae bacterium]|nr:hypothetical protein [Solirubrobacteraceae bacterium]